MADATSPVTGPHSTPHDRRDLRTGSPFAARATIFLLAIAAIVLAIVAYQEKSTLSDLRTQLNRSTSDDTQARSDLDKYRTQAGSLQTQLDQANAHAADAQAQLATSQGRQADLQAQLVKAQSVQTDLRTQIDNAKAQSVDLQNELSRANDSAADARKQLDQANARAAGLQQQLDKVKTSASGTQAAAAAPTLPLPVVATFEKGFWGGNYTLHVRNQNSNPLAVSISVDGAPAKSTTIQSGTTYDLGDLKGGSSVVISSNGFQSSTLTVK